jgi:hypothetical protein
LVNFSVDMDWAQQAGHARIERFTAAQQSTVFANSAVVKEFRMILVDGDVALAGCYPTRVEMARRAGISKRLCRGKSRWAWNACWN